MSLLNSLLKRLAAKFQIYDASRCETAAFFNFSICINFQSVYFFLETRCLLLAIVLSSYSESFGRMKKIALDATDIRILNAVQKYGQLS
ncbi:MAG TPA: hypothetical protein VLA51_04440, partial [Paracoccaceae bacterium]|nr:hypothetical protein [Paracoccaceae bacterium]